MCHHLNRLTQTVVGGAGCCLHLLHVLWPLAGALLEELHCGLLLAPADVSDDDYNDRDDLQLPDVNVGEPAEGAHVGLAVQVQLRHVVYPVNGARLGLERLLGR